MALIQPCTLLAPLPTAMNSVGVDVQQTVSMTIHYIHTTPLVINGWLLAWLWPLP